MFDTTDLYVFFYKLNVIDYLINSEDNKSEEEKDWVYRFIAYEGFENIIRTFFKFIDSYEEHKKNRVLLEILDVLIDISANFFMKCYANQQVLSCQILFAM